MSADTTNSQKGPMDCARVIADDITEKYLLGELSEADTEAFEQHYFDCARCFEELRACRTMRTVLRQGGPVVRPALT